MIDIYLRRFSLDGQTIDGRRKIQSVPAKNQNEIYLLNPTVKCEIGNAGSMDFSVQSGTKYYDSFLQLRTIVEVDYDGETIFFGRVLTIDNGFFGERKIHCEGALSFLNDSYYPASKEDERAKISAFEYIKAILNNHNNQIADGVRKIYPGEVPGNYSGSISAAQQVKNESREYGNTSWSETKSALEELKSYNGGAFRIRYSDGRCYLDWLDQYFRSTVNQQRIEVGKNLIELSSVTEVSNIFTAIIPIGKTTNGDKNIYIAGYRTDIHGDNNYLTVPQIVGNFYTRAQLNSGYHKYEDYVEAVNKYGLIFKTVQIDEGDSQKKLLEKAAEWIKNNFMGEIESFTVKAIDFRQIGEATDKILCGDRVRIIYPVGSADGQPRKGDQILTCTSVTYDLYNPENNQYAFGIPSAMLTKNYGTKSTKKTKSKVSDTSTPDYGPSPETDPQQAWMNDVTRWLHGHKVWYKSAGNRQSGPYNGGSGNDNLFLHVHATAKDDDGNFKWMLFYPTFSTSKGKDGKETINWIRDGQGHVYWSWSTYAKEQAFSLAQIKKHRLFEYVLMEYGVDLKTGLKHKMPANTTDELGETIMCETSFNSAGQAIAGAVSGIVGGVDPTTGLGKIDLIGMVLNAFGNGGAGGAFSSVINLFNGAGLFAGGTTPDPITGLTNGMQIKDGLLSILKQNPQTGATVYEKSCVQIDNTAEEANAKSNEARNNLSAVASALASAGTLDFISFDKPILAPTMITATVYTQDMNGVNAELQNIKSDYAKIDDLDGHIARIPMLSVNSLSIAHSANCVGYVYADNFVIGQNSSSSAPTNKYVSNAITELQVVAVNAKTYKIQKKDFADSDWIDVPGTFSTATSLSGAWGGVEGRSGRTYTVTASPQDEELVLELADGDTTGNQQLAGSWSGNTYTGKIAYVVGTTAASKIYGNTGLSYLVNASSRYNAGWNAARDRIILPEQNLSSGNFIFYEPPTTVDGTAEAYRFKVENSGNNSVLVNYVDSNQDLIRSIAKFNHNKYDAGWGAAVDKLSIPGEGSGGSISVGYPPSTVDGSATTRQYELYNDSKNIAILRYNTAAAGQQPVYKTAASLTHNRYNGGWNAARSSVVGKTYTVSGKTYNYFPTATVTDSNRLAYIQVAQPSSTVDGSLSAISYYITSGANTAYIRYNSSSGNIVAKLDHNQYTAGSNAGHDGISGDDIDLNGDTSTSEKSSKPSTTISKGVSSFSGGIWIKKSNNNWKKIRDFSISTGAISYNGPLYYKSGDTYQKVTNVNTLIYTKS